MQNSQQDRDGVALGAHEPATRRSFLRASAFSALGAGFLAACRGGEAATTKGPGSWAFYCHILPHGESDHGIFGMVTALVVQK